MYFSKEINESLTYKFSQAANEMKKQGREILSLGLGEPDFETPQYIKDATFEAINSGFTHYSASQGLPELRSLIAGYVSEQYKVAFDASDVIVTPGVKAALFLALASVLEPFDEVICITPYYVSYPSLIKLAEPTANIKYCAIDTVNYTLDIEKLRGMFSDKTRCILLNTPHNPTGMLLSKDETEAIVDLCLKNNTYILSDEVYDKLVYKDSQYVSFGEYKEIKDLLILLNGYSKSYAMTGWRLGYALAPKEVVGKMNKIQQHVNTNTCTFIQKGACAIYKNEPIHLKPYVDELERRIEFFHENINSTKTFRGVKPKAGFFYFADISESGYDSNSFCIKLLHETGIATTPGLAFGHEWDNYVRFSVAADFDIIKRAVALIRDAENTNGSCLKKNC